MHALIKVLFECQHCGKCCKITRAYSLADVDRIEEHTGEDRETIKSKLEEQTCGYLVNNICSIHLFKPTVCRWWPGPGVNGCPGYEHAMASFNMDGYMHRICSEPQLAELYTKCILNNDLLAAQELLKRLNK